ncbi:hypothetical protein [Streptacidiphilus cavernicola]|uniref:Uncharacterized protein n=1 Tax=Streptacidiphilus cavernicola TaxID=3342716 RepID=A0ABV6VPF4_9ACTN
MRNRNRWVGLAGTTALALGGADGAGALPSAAGVRHPSIGLFLAYFGLVLLVGAWWRLGRTVRSDRPPSSRELLLTLAVWAAPLLLATGGGLLALVALLCVRPAR